MLKYDLHVACVEYEPGNDLLFSNPNATLIMELIKTRKGYALNFKVDIRRPGLSSKDFARNKSRAYIETEFRKSVIFEYD